MDHFNGTNGNNNEAITCRVAYMINNQQPVICTHIGDQPLFYADDIALEEEEDLLMEEASADDLLFRLTQEGLKDKAIQLQQKKEAFIDANRPDIEDLFTQNAEAIIAKNEAGSLDKILKIFAKSRLGKSLLDFAEENDIEIKRAGEVSSVEYDRQSGVILVPNALEEGLTIIGLAQELRRVWQHKNGSLINPLAFHPEDAITVNRVQLADLCAVKTRIAWEAHLEGHDEAWGCVAASGLSDIAFTFVREVRKDFRSLNNGWAMQFAFEKWFLSDRCKIEDKHIIQSMLADHGGLVFENESSQMISIDVVMRLAEMPFGQNYLRGYASSIIGDPLFTEIRDRSSANFLWFIKFESAFKDKERDLKNPPVSGNNKTSVRTTLFESLEEEDYNAEEGFGEIISFPNVFEARGRNKSRIESARSDATVIELFNNGKEQ